MKREQLATYRKHLEHRDKGMVRMWLANQSIYKIAETYSVPHLPQMKPDYVRARLRKQGFTNVNFA
jgi:hypothetical protein